MSRTFGIALFGIRRCMVCLGRGSIDIVRARATRTCPLCNGSKKEKCKRCAGRGLSGVKTSQIQRTRPVKWPLE